MLKAPASAMIPDCGTASEGSGTPCDAAYAIVWWEKWPGHVRELQNVIERVVILARGEVLEFDLPIRDAPPTTQSHPGPPLLLRCVRSVLP